LTVRVLFNILGLISSTVLANLGMVVMKKGNAQNLPLDHLAAVEVER
jgi:hypothetical protein